MAKPSEQLEAALEEFGFSTEMRPSPGRIADRLADIEFKLEDAIKSGSWEWAAEACRELGRLRALLDAFALGRIPE